MGKFLKFLVILLLPISIASLILGIRLHQKRIAIQKEMTNLQQTVFEVGTTLEDAEPAAKKAAFEERDIDKCSARGPDDPELADFWSKYPLQLEDQDAPRMTLSPTNITASDLGAISERATRQIGVLNTTRRQLTDVRKELVDAIADINPIKADFRATLKDLDTVKSELEELKNTVVLQLEKQVEELTSERSSLQGQLDEKDNDNARLSEELNEKEDYIGQLKEELDELTRQANQSRARSMAQLASGEKAYVASISPQWGFAILQINPVFLQEIGQLNNEDFAIELFVKRGSEYVGKLRLVPGTLKPELNIVVADVLGEWQQLPVQVGDVAFF